MITTQISSLSLGNSPKMKRPRNAATPKMTDESEAISHDPFPATRWSIVARSTTDSAKDRGEAWSVLFHSYWLPLYTYVRRRGHSEADAEDLTQGFFAMLSRRGPLTDVDASRGKLRAYLLTALKHFLIGEHRKETSLKRGGGAHPLSIDVNEAESRIAATASAAASPDLAFDQQWALALIDETLSQIEDEYTKRGKEDLFEAFRPYISVQSDRSAHRDIAEQLGMKPGAVRIAVYRLRQRFAAIMREKIEETVLSSEDADEELNYLMRVFSTDDAPAESGIPLT